MLANARKPLEVLRRNILLEEVDPDSNPDGNFSLQQGCSNLTLHVCKLVASLARQDCKFTTSLQNRRSTTRRIYSKLVASSSWQTIAKTEYADEAWIRSLDNLLCNLSP
ncbi:hypothetical protein AVEN_227971-1 [Araneus ventricosus]|uniref:Uncharacterized protein n=1 Tax=Araneus ventricosus TaxID=182803 RepID=A0A4Y2TDB1_ARAVE|nr:hypothetical protein AVEN_227971-1 [Araneus ventricosus]